MGIPKILVVTSVEVLSRVNYWAMIVAGARMLLFTLEGSIRDSAAPHRCRYLIWQLGTPLSPGSVNMINIKYIISIQIYTDVLNAH